MEKTLTAQDRCDGCSAAALVRVAKDESLLQFCGHHHKKSAAALETAGFAVVENIMEGDLVTAGR